MSDVNKRFMNWYAENYKIADQEVTRAECELESNIRCICFMLGAALGMFISWLVLIIGLKVDV